MIEVLMYYGTEIVLIRISGNDVRFGNSSYGAQMATIEGMKLDKHGVLKEFPELKDNPNWRVEAIAKFKDKIREIGNERKIAKYLIEDLKKFGYIPKFIQEAGKRREVILDGG